MLKDSFGAAESDKQARMLREAVVDAQRLIEAIQAALAEDGETLLSADERGQIHTHIDALVALCQGDDSHAVNQATEALNHATEAFAAKRMDASVQKALAGKNLDSLEL
jgi:molecular chaperone HscA